MGLFIRRRLMEKHSRELTAGDVFELLPKKVEMGRRIRAIDDEMSKLNDERHKLDRFLDTLKDVNEIFEGQPLHIWGCKGETPDIDITPVCHDPDGKDARVYLNRHNDRTWRVNCRKDRQHGGSHEALSEDYERYDDAVLAAKMFVVWGILPKGAKFLFATHEPDPRVAVIF